PCPRARFCHSMTQGYRGSPADRVAVCQTRTVDQVRRSMNWVLRNRRGFALESTVVVMVLLTVLIGAAVTSAVMTQRTAGVDYRGSRVSYATEAGADNVMSQLEVAMADGIVTPAELAALTPPVVPGFTYSPISTVAGAPVPRTITSGPFAG